MLKINQTYFGNREYIRHTDNIAEAPDFASDEQADGFRRLIDGGIIECGLHTHEEHFPNDENYIVLTPECIDTNSNVTENDTGTLDGISAFCHKLLDAAVRYTNKPMKLRKLVMHRYVLGASSEPHADVFPLATLLYLNDDYEGGELYFPNQNFEIKPTAKSLLVFQGGGENLHGVKQVRGDLDEVNPRYVVVAFWDYSNNEDQAKFSQIADNTESQWKKENHWDHGDSLVSRYGSKATIRFSDTFPILDIKDFMVDDARELIRFLELNEGDYRDGCWAPVCFREYWERLNPDSDRQPIFTDDTDENTLKNINLKIKEHVEFFLKKEVAFSKFKGHRSGPGASAPPHYHPPAVAVAMVALDDKFSGGEIFIPNYDIEFSPEAGHLYIFEENEMSKHGFKKIIEGRRLLLMSHWQDVDNTYDWAGVDH